MPYFGYICTELMCQSYIPTTTGNGGSTSFSHAYTAVTEDSSFRTDTTKADTTTPRKPSTQSGTAVINSVCNSCVDTETTALC